MWCSACGLGVEDLVCRRCRLQLRRAPERWLAGEPGLRVRSAFHHEAAARVLVHRVKYEGSRRAAAALADSVASLIPIDALIMPVPRVWARRWQFGVQQTTLIASCLPEHVRSRVVMGLAAPLWAQRHAGTGRSRRRSVKFSARNLPHPASEIVLLDDVVTTGSTLQSAAAALHAKGFRQVSAVTATTSTEVTSL